MMSLKIKNLSFSASKPSRILPKLNCGALVCFAMFAYATQAQDSSVISTDGDVYTLDDVGDYVNEDGYRVPQSDENEFNNHSDSFVRNWKDADPEHEDTGFGQNMYNEPSTATKLEILRLISKDTPSITVLLHAVTMGLDIEETLKATADYDPGKASDLVASALSILPVLSESNEYQYSGYQLEDLEQEDENKPYRVQEVIDKYFEQRLVLRPYPDWFEGQYHFLASAAELKSLQNRQKKIQWYETKSPLQENKRPIFVSLYEATDSVVIDGVARIDKALASDPNAVLPVVFVFNKLRERSLDQLNYPKTLRGVQQAYYEKSLMLSPVPEWQIGDYHMYVDIAEFYEILELPEEEDFEPEAWQKLLEEAEDYSVNNTSFLMTIVPGEVNKRNDEGADGDSTAKRFISNEQLYAAWDDPRTESKFKYARPKDGLKATLKNIMTKGFILNRPDLLVALNALGVQKVPVTFYYLDSSRVASYVKGGRALANSVQGVITKPSGSGGSGGISLCASPPCVEQ